MLMHVCYFPPSPRKARNTGGYWPSTEGFWPVARAPHRSAEQRKQGNEDGEIMPAKNAKYLRWVCMTIRENKVKKAGAFGSTTDGPDAHG